MWSKVEEYVRSHRMIEKGDRVLLGLSGGADSVLLARYLLSIKNEKGLFLHAVHVNHMIREGGAQRDEEFVRDFCRLYEIPLTVFRTDVTAISDREKISLEEAGRKERYRLFYETARKENCQKIAVAHHAVDQAETIIFRMIRGTGPTGLSGIRPINEPVIRPLLCLEKREILDLLSELSQDYVEDETNTHLDYSRNYIRHEILPLMQKMNDKAVTHLNQLAVQMEEMTNYLAPKMEHLYNEKILHISKGLLLREEDYISWKELERSEVIRRMLFEAAGVQKDIGYLHVKQMRELMDKPPGKQISLPYRLIAVRKEEGIFLCREDEMHTEMPEKRKIDSIEIDLKPGMKPLRVIMDSGEQFLIEISKYNGEKIPKSDCVKYFDYGKIKNVLCIRNRQSGDYFIMDSSGRKKMLKRFFIDEKIPSGERAQRYLLADGSHILWIVGSRISEAYKVQDCTKYILRVSFI